MKQTHRIFEADSVPRLLELQEECLAASDGYAVAFKRYFLTDPSQSAGLPKEQGAVSVICQPPLSGASVGVWLWLVSGAELRKSDSVTIALDGDDTHIWTSGLVSSGASDSPATENADGRLRTSEDQMATIFRRYDDILQPLGLTLEGNCVRTWIFVDDIDNNYSGAVRGRREHFNTAGLTPETHYIASTGIQGRPCVPGELVQMDTYAIASPALRQRYLYAPTHLNPTYEYGVTFERGVCVECANSGLTVISGTASIDNKGAVLHVGDILMQTRRMWENVETLLAEAGKGWRNVAQILVYLRNPSDYEAVAPLFARKFPDTPYIILLAPVCRPDWLIEMECLA